MAATVRSAGPRDRRRLAGHRSLLILEIFWQKVHIRKRNLRL
jgi:hypothetical protein